MEILRTRKQTIIFANDPNEKCFDYWQVVSTEEWDKLGEGSREILLTNNGIKFVKRIKNPNNY